MHHRLNKSAIRMPSTTVPVELSSDPIEKFSSPNSKDSLFGKPTGLLAPPILDPIHEVRTDANDKLLAAAAETSDEEMPAIGDIVFQEQERRKKEGLRQTLQAKKLAALQSRTGGPFNIVEEDDDDLEIVKDDMHLVASEEAAKRRADKTKQSPVKKKVLVMAIGHKSTSKGSDSYTKSGPPLTLSEQHLKQFAKPAFVRSKDDKEPLTKQQLDRMIMQQHEHDKLKVIKQREEEWMQRGGRNLREDGGNGPQTSLSQTLSAYAERALKAEADVVEGTDESDGDYAPSLRGSATPDPPDLEADETNSTPDQKLNDAVSNTIDQLSDEDEEPILVGRKSGARRSARVILGSDDEDGEPLAGQFGVPSLLLAGVASGSRTEHRHSMSSAGSQTEDENDKENNTKLMFDRSEDKENKAVVRHSPMSSRTAPGSRMGSLIRLESGVQRSLSNVSLPTDSNDMVTSSQETVRSPLKELPRDDDDPFSFSPSAAKLPFTERLLQTGPSSPPCPSPSLKQGPSSPTSLRSERTRRLSQISLEGQNDENNAPGFQPQVLLPSFMEANKKRSPGLSLAPLNPANGLSQFFSVGLSSLQKFSPQVLTTWTYAGRRYGASESRNLKCKRAVIDLGHWPATCFGNQWNTPSQGRHDLR